MGLMAAAADTLAALAEAMKALQPVDKPRCEFIQDLVKAVVLMEIQPGLHGTEDLYEAAVLPTVMPILIHHHSLSPMILI